MSAQLWERQALDLALAARTPASARPQWPQRCGAVMAAAVQGEEKLLAQEWAARRGSQLGQIPRQLWPTLQAKLGGAPGREVFDAGLHFTMDWDEDAGWRVYVTGEVGVVPPNAAVAPPAAAALTAAAAATTAPAELWLIDHAWTYTPASAHATLRSHAGLLERVLGLATVDPPRIAKQNLAWRAQRPRCGGISRATGCHVWEYGG